MKRSRWVWVAFCAAIGGSAAASNIGSDFLDAQLYRTLLTASKGGRHTFADWLGTSVIKRLNITGQQSLGLHLQHVQGDTIAYDNATAFGQGGQTFTDIGQMNIAGNKVAGLFNFNYSFADNRYQDPSAHRLSVNYDKGPWKLDAGDITASLLGGNRFLSFSRQLRGVSVGFTTKNLSVRVLDSRAASSTTTISFNGNNSPGPYYLQASQLIADSVRVEVDGHELNYPNDFTVNPVIGSITFNILSVAPTSTIVVSYESTGVNGGGGTIQGAGAQLSFGKFGSIGVSAIRQLDPLGSGLSTYVDRYQGYGDPSIPYILQYVPLASAPIIVTLDGVVQVLNVDYQFSATNPTVFYFLRYIPTTSTITVTYTPAPNANLHGDRQVEGFDYVLPLGRNGRSGSINYSQALSHLSNAAEPLSGTARGLAATYKLKRFTFTGSVDDIPPTFVGVESTSFQRNERASSMGIEYKENRLTASLNGSNSAISSMSLGSNGSLTFEPARDTRLDAGLHYRTDSGMTWSFDQQHLTNWTVNGAAVADESTFSLSKVLGRLNNHFNLSHTQGSGPISDGITTTNGSVRLNSVGWNGDYAASRGWTFGARGTLSQVDTNGANGLGTDASASLAYREPGKPFGFDTAYTYSNSGQIATLGGFQDGFGAGYNGNGFSGGATGSTLTPGGTGFNAGGTDVNRWQTAANWMLAKRASIGANFFTSKETGTISTNANSVGYGTSLDYDLQNGQRLGLSLDQSLTTFSNAQESANSLSFDLFVGGRPKGPWSYRLGVGTLLSSGGTIAQNNFHYALSLKNFFKENQALGFEIASSSLTNYEPQNDFSIAALYEYRLFKNVSILGKYQIHNVVNLDPTVTTGSFNSRGFDLQLNFNFGS